MEVSMFTGFNDLGMNDPSFFHHQQLQVNSLEELFGPAILPAYCYGSTYDQSAETTQSLSRKRYAQTDLPRHTDLEKPFKQLKTNICDSYDQINHILNSHDHHASNSTMLSFSNSSNSSSQASALVTPKEEVAVSNVTFSSPQHEMVVDQASFDKKSCKLEVPRPQFDKKSSNFASMPQQSMDHILAERKRREKLSQRFIALSAIIPGLKKMDKASVLGDAIKYVKQMQERVQTLEEKTKKKPIESAVLVKRCYVSAEDKDHFSADTSLFSGGSCEGQLPEIEVRMSDKDILVSIHCEKKKGVVEKVISQIEELHLVVICSSSLAFGSSALALTIIAQMGAEFNMTGSDLVRELHTTLKCLI